LKGHQFFLKGLFVYGVQKEVDAFFWMHPMHFRSQKMVHKLSCYGPQNFKVGVSKNKLKKISYNIVANKQARKHCWLVSTYPITKMNSTRDEQTS